MNLPSREECEGWDQAQVAHFLCKNQMQECVVTINKLKINGQKLLCLSDSEISKFSLIHQPQLQKIVQDIKKNEDSLLNKLRRLKGKPLPKVPARDYRDDHDEQLSDSDYDNDMYEDPREGSYEPPPPHRVFTAAPSTSFSRGEYLDNPINPPQRPPKKPLRPGKASKQLPPEPTRMESDEENYIDPDGHDDDDNYVEPAENHLSNPVIHRRNRAGRGRPMLSTPSPERPPSPDVYEVPDEEDRLSWLCISNRLCPIPRTSSHSTPPKPSPRLTRRRSPTALQGPTGNDEYEVCDADECSSSVPTEAHPPFPPKPLPRERSPKPPLKPRPDLKPREFESHTLPAVQTDPRPPQKAFTLDLKRPKIPLPQLSSLQTKNERRSVCDENEPTEQDKDADICNKPWYASTCDRKTADDVLVRANKDGAFLVRKSSGHDAQQPYTLVVFYKGRVYNIPVRFIATSQQYALGREKRGEEYFSSISHIIENHKRTPLVLIDSQSNTKDTTRLWFPVRP
ncbi:uncharacterized protein V6R79_003530 [Siganus canaliculatus]